MKPRLSTKHETPTKSLSRVPYSAFAQDLSGNIYFYISGGWVTLDPKGYLQKVNSFGTDVIQLPAGTEIVLTSTL